MNTPHTPRSPQDMAKIASDRAAKQAEVATLRHKLAKAFAEIFGHDDASRTERQKAVMKNLREVCCMDQTTLQPEGEGAIDPYLSHVREGRRQIGLHIQHMIAHAAEPPPNLS